MTAVFTAHARATKLAALILRFTRLRRSRPNALVQPTSGRAQQIRFAILRMVYRMHGGKAGAPKGERNGAYRDGRHIGETKAARRKLRESIRLLWTLARLARDL